VLSIESYGGSTSVDNQGDGVMRKPDRKRAASLRALDPSELVTATGGVGSIHRPPPPPPDPGG